MTRTLWPPVKRGFQPNPFAITLATFLTHQGGRPSPGVDANLRTHNRLRCTGLHGNVVHRVDAVLPRFYTTGCGLRVAKVGATLTAAEVTCEHHGCPEREVAL